MLFKTYSWVIVFACLFLLSCGYKFSGGGNLPSDIRSVCITILENRTAETGVENIITNDLIYEFTRAGNVVLTDKDKAEAILAGIVQSVRSDTISHRGTHTSLERRVKVVVNLKLTGQDGRTIWSVKDISENEDYVVMPEKSATERNKRDAISELSKRLAENIYNRLTDAF